MTASQQFIPQLSKLFALNILDEADELESSISNAYTTHIQSLLNSPPSTQLSSLNHIIHSTSTAAAAQPSTDATPSIPPSVDIFHGLVYGYLAAETLGIQGNPIFENIWTLGELQPTLRLLQRIALDKFQKLLPNVRERFWELVLKVTTQDNTGEGASLIEILIRYMRVSLWANDKLLAFLLENMNWVLKQEGMLQSAVYVCLRLVMYHIRGISTGAIDLPQNPAGALQKMGQMEEQFCVQAIRGRFDVMIGIGRDFVRALNYSAFYVPSLRELYQQMMSDPQKLDAHNHSYMGPPQILSTPTSRRVLIAALTPDMERQIFFLMNKVKWGNQRRYQTWFAQMYFAVPGSQVCIVDLIRFTNVVYHPKVQKIQAGMVFRWGILGWLLTTISDKDSEGKRLHHESLVACIFDWLCFNPKKDSIMNIEPSMLLMMHSIPKYVELTISVMQMILSHCKKGDADADKEPSGETFLLSRDVVTLNVQNAMYKALQKKIIQTIAPIMLYEKMPQPLVDQMKAVFGGIEQQVNKDLLQMKHQQVGQPPLSPQKPQQQVTTSTTPSSPPVMHQQSGVMHPHAGGAPAAGGNTTPPVRQPFVSPVASPPGASPPPSTNDQPSPPQLQLQTPPPQVVAHPHSPTSPTPPPTENSAPPASPAPTQTTQSTKIAPGDHRSELEQIIPPQAVSITQNALSFFQPHLNDLANFTSTMYQNGRKNPIISNKAQECLVRVLEHFERERDEVLTEDNIRTLGQFLIEVLSQEWVVHGKDKRALLNMTLTRATESLWFSMLAHIHRILSQPKQIGNAANISKRSKSRYAQLLRYMCNHNTGLGYRILSYCIRRNKCFLEDVQDLILSSPSISTSDRHSKDILINVLPSKIKKPSNPKKYLSFYEWSIQIRRQNDQSPREIFLEDMKSCAEELDSLFLIMLPLVSKYFDNFTMDGEEGSTTIFELICSYLSPAQLCDVASLVSTGRLLLLGVPYKNDTLVALVKQILTWDHYRQTSAFDLLQSELDRRTHPTPQQVPQDNATTTQQNGTSTTLSPSTLIQDLLEEKTFDPRKNRDILARLRHLFTLPIVAQHYTLSEDLTRFLLLLNPCDYGHFTSTFIYFWMYNRNTIGAAQRQFGVYHIDQQINNVMEQFIGANETEQADNIERVEYFLLNLLLIRNTEIETRITRAHRTQGVSAASNGDNSPSQDTPHMLFSSMVLVRNLRRLREVVKYKNIIHIQSLINKLIEEIPGVKLKTIEEDDDLMEIEESEEEEPLSPPVTRKQSRKRKRVTSTESGAESEELGVIPIAQRRRKRRRKTAKDYTEESSEESSAEEEEGESMEDEEEEPTEADSGAEESGEDEEEEGKEEKEKKTATRRRGRPPARAKREAKKTEENNEEEESEEEEDKTTKKTRGRPRAAATKKTTTPAKRTTRRNTKKEEEDQEEHSEEEGEEESSEEEDKPSAREQRALRRRQSTKKETTTKKSSSKKSTRGGKKEEKKEDSEESDQSAAEEDKKSKSTKDEAKKPAKIRRVRRVSQNKEEKEQQSEEEEEDAAAQSNESEEEEDKAAKVEGKDEAAEEENSEEDKDDAKEKRGSSKRRLRRRS